MIMSFHSLLLMPALKIECCFGNAVWARETFLKHRQYSGEYGVHEKCRRGPPYILAVFEALPALSVFDFPVLTYQCEFVLNDFML